MVKSFYDRGSSKPKKSGLEQFGSDIRMGLGLEKQTPSYKARTAITMKKNKESEKNKRESSDDRKPSGPPAQTAFERKKAEKLAKERAEGQKKRKAFEKKMGEKYARRRRLLFNTGQEAPW